MAGTLFGLGLSQRVNPNGLPEGGWKLYLYAAASDTPVTAYKDTGLTAGLEHPWPVQADAYGTMPAFWLADGSYRARGISSDGSRVFFDMTSVLAIGASSGSGGGGSSVDANAIFKTGDVMWQEAQGTRSGWVRDNGRTIGSATSGATERANSDTQALFLFGWAAGWSVVGGSGATAAADWAANKQITLPDKRGYTVGGLDGMGNSAAGRYSGVPVLSGAVDTAGSVLGENGHTLTASESAVLTYTATSTSDLTYNDATAHTHFLGGEESFQAFIGPNATASLGGSITTTVSTNAGGGSHNTVQKTVLGTFYRKL